MRIGVFTDTYLPVSNGICFVIDIIKKDLEAAGHEVFIFAPKNVLKKQPKEKNIFRINSIQGVLYSDQFFSFYRPAHQLNQIEKLNLDVVMVFTPSLIGGLGIYAAKKLDIPYVIQYGTDMESYGENYKFTTLAGFVGALAFEPHLAKMGLVGTLKFYKSALLRRSKDNFWRESVRQIMKPMHEGAAAVIATSEKTAEQLSCWKINQRVEVIPTGVDALPASKEIARNFMQEHGLSVDDELVLYAGRMSVEKNLDKLVEAFGRVVSRHPKAKLLMVGDFQYRQQLEEKAAATHHADSVIFTGLVDRNVLGAVYPFAKVFAFPSLTDCQALVLNEAAHAGVPLVWCDSEKLNPVLRDGVTGLRAKDSAKDLADKINRLLGDEKLRQDYCHNAKKMARQFSEATQSKKIESLLKRIVNS